MCLPSGRNSEKHMWDSYSHQELDGEVFEANSVTSGIEYFAADVIHKGQDHRKKNYGIIWILEGEAFQVLGVVNAYRRKT